MDEFLKDLRWFLGWAIPALIKLVLILAVLIIALALLPFWIFFRMPGLGFMQLAGLIWALSPPRPYGPPVPRKEKPLRDHSIDGSGQYRICLKCGERSLITATHCRNCGEMLFEDWR